MNSSAIHGWHLTPSLTNRFQRMNLCLYRVALFVMCLSPRVNARDIFLSLTKNSEEDIPVNPKKEGGNEESAEATKEETNFPIAFLRVASHTKTYAQSLRRLLKTIRKWCNSHPLEVKLGKCFASYFNIKIPGLRRNEQFDDYNGDPGKTKLSHKKNKSCEKETKLVKRETNLKCEKEEVADNPKSWSLNVGNFLSGMKAGFEFYTDAVVNNKMAVCLWDYLVKRFWIWVDTAPDS